MREAGLEPFREWKQKDDRIRILKAWRRNTRSRKVFANGRKILRTFRPPQRRAGKSHRPRPVCGRPRLSGHAPRRDRAQQRRARAASAAFASATAFRGTNSRSSPPRIFPAKMKSRLIEHDQPCLAAEFINHPEEADRSARASRRYLLEEARRAVQIDVEPLPAIFTIEDSLAKRAIIWGEDNVFKSYPHGKRRRGQRVGAGRYHRRRRIPHRRAGTALHRKSGHDRRWQIPRTA